MQAFAWQHVIAALPATMVSAFTKQRTTALLMAASILEKADEQVVPLPTDQVRPLSAATELANAADPARSVPVHRAKPQGHALTAGHHDALQSCGPGAETFSRAPHPCNTQLHDAMHCRLASLLCQGCSETDLTGRTSLQSVHCCGAS